MTLARAIGVLRRELANQFAAVNGNIANLDGIPACLFDGCSELGTLKGCFLICTSCLRCT